MTLRELRKNKGITQSEAAAYVEVPLRTYCNYENDPSKQASIKYKYILEKLLSFGVLDESHGILDVEKIREVCADVFSSYPVDYCYLFGSYAKGRATPESDVDLLVCTSVRGIEFFEIVEILREKLGKKVDLLDQKQIVNNFELVNEILKDGIKIYG